MKRFLFLLFLGLTTTMFAQLPKTISSDGWYQVAVVSGAVTSCNSEIYLIDGNASDSLAFFLSVTKTSINDSKRTIYLRGDSFYSPNIFKSIRVSQKGVDDNIFIEAYIELNSASNNLDIFVDDFSSSCVIVRDYLNESLPPAYSSQILNVEGFQAGVSNYAPSVYRDGFDDNPLNEIQSLSFSGDTIFLSNGGGFVNLESLGSSGDYVDLTSNQFNIDGEKTFIGSVEFSNAPRFGGTVSELNQNSMLVTKEYVDFGLSQDNDGDNTNEIQSLSITNGNLTISNGNTIDLRDDSFNPMFEISGDANSFSLTSLNSVSGDSVAWRFHYDDDFIYAKGLHGISFTSMRFEDLTGEVIPMPNISSFGEIANTIDVDMISVSGLSHNVSGLKKNANDYNLKDVRIEHGIYRRNKWYWSHFKNIKGVGDLAKNQPDYVSRMNRNLSRDDFYVRISNQEIEGVRLIDDQYCTYTRLDTVDAFRRVHDTAIHSYTKTGIYSFSKNYDSKTGDFAETQGNSYATSIGSSMSVSFEGTGIDFRYLQENRGAIWEFVLDGGVDTIIVDTYGGAAQKTVELFQGIESGTHTVVGTVTGVNPANTSGQNRGWYSFHDTDDSKKTFGIYTGESISTTLVENLLNDASNKEFAILFDRPEGTVDQWLPSHTTYFPVQLDESNGDYVKVYIDGIERTETNGFEKAQSIKVVQNLSVYQFQYPEQFAQITGSTTINSEGHHVSYSIDWLRESRVRGYTMMFPVHGLWADRLYDGNGFEYDLNIADNSAEDIKLNDFSSNFIATSDSDDWKVAIRINEEETKLPNGTARRTDSYGRGSVMWIKHNILQGENQKLYTNVYDYNKNPVIPSGTQTIVDYSVQLGYFPSFLITKREGEIR